MTFTLEKTTSVASKTKQAEAVKHMETHCVNYVNKNDLVPRLPNMTEFARKGLNIIPDFVLNKILQTGFLKCVSKDTQKFQHLSQLRLFADNKWKKASEKDLATFHPDDGEHHYFCGMWIPQWWRKIQCLRAAIADHQMGRYQRTLYELFSIPWENDKPKTIPLKKPYPLNQIYFSYKRRDREIIYYNYDRHGRKFRIPQLPAVTPASPLTPHPQMAVTTGTLDLRDPLWVQEFVEQIKCAKLTDENVEDIPDIIHAHIVQYVGNFQWVLTNTIDKIMQDKVPFDVFPIRLYTTEWNSHDVANPYRNVYSALNRVLSSEGTRDNLLQDWAPFIRLLLDSLHKHAKLVTGAVCWRGQPRRVNDENKFYSKFTPGQIVSWWTFMSTSLQKEKATQWMNSPTEGILFKVTDVEGYYLDEVVSVNPHCQEVLLPPCTEFMVVSKNVKGKLIEIELRMIGRGKLFDLSNPVFEGTLQIQPTFPFEQLFICGGSFATTLGGCDDDFDWYYTDTTSAVHYPTSVASRLERAYQYIHGKKEESSEPCSPEQQQELKELELCLQQTQLPVSQGAQPDEQPAIPSGYVAMDDFQQQQHEQKNEQLTVWTCIGNVPYSINVTTMTQTNNYSGEVVPIVRNATTNPTPASPVSPPTPFSPSEPAQWCSIDPNKRYPVEYSADLHAQFEAAYQNGQQTVHFALPTDPHNTLRVAEFSTMKQKNLTNQNERKIRRCPVQWSSVDPRNKCKVAYSTNNNRVLENAYQSGADEVNVTIENVGVVRVVFTSMKQHTTSGQREITRDVIHDQTSQLPIAQPQVKPQPHCWLVPARIREKKTKQQNGSADYLGNNLVVGTQQKGGATTCMKSFTLTDLEKGVPKVLSDHTAGVSFNVIALDFGLNNKGDDTDNPYHQSLQSICNYGNALLNTPPTIPNQADVECIDSLVHNVSCSSHVMLCLINCAQFVTNKDCNRCFDIIQAALIHHKHQQQHIPDASIVYPAVAVLYHLVMQKGYFVAFKDWMMRQTAPTIVSDLISVLASHTHNVTTTKKVLTVLDALKKDTLLFPLSECQTTFTNVLQVHTCDKLNDQQKHIVGSVCRIVEQLWKREELPDILFFLLQNVSDQMKNIANYLNEEKFGSLSTSGSSFGIPHLWEPDSPQKGREIPIPHVKLVAVPKQGEEPKIPPDRRHLHGRVHEEHVPPQPQSQDLPPCCEEVVMATVDFLYHHPMELEEVNGTLSELDIRTSHIRLTTENVETLYRLRVYLLYTSWELHKLHKWDNSSITVNTAEHFIAKSAKYLEMFVEQPSWIHQSQSNPTLLRKLCMSLCTSLLQDIHSESTEVASEQYGTGTMHASRATPPGSPLTHMESPYVGPDVSSSSGVGAIHGGESMGTRGSSVGQPPSWQYGTRTDTTATSGCTGCSDTFEAESVWVKRWNHMYRRMEKLIPYDEWSMVRELKHPVMSDRCEQLKEYFTHPPGSPHREHIAVFVRAFSAPRTSKLTVWAFNSSGHRSAYKEILYPSAGELADAICAASCGMKLAVRTTSTTAQSSSDAQSSANSEKRPDDLLWFHDSTKNPHNGTFCRGSQPHILLYSVLFNGLFGPPSSVTDAPTEYTIKSESCHPVYDFEDSDALRPNITFFSRGETELVQFPWLSNGTDRLMDTYSIGVTPSFTHFYFLDKFYHEILKPATNCKHAWKEHILVDSTICSDKYTKPILPQHCTTTTSGPTKDIVNGSFEEYDIVQVHGHGRRDEVCNSNVKQVSWFNNNDVQERLHPTELLKYYSGRRDRSLLCLLTTCFASPRKGVGTDYQACSLGQALHDLGVPWVIAAPSWISEDECAEFPKFYHLLGTEIWPEIHRSCGKEHDKTLIGWMCTGLPHVKFPWLP